MTEINLPDVSFKDLSLADFDRVSKLRSNYFKASPEICTERARLLTEFHLDPANDLFNKDRISILDKARAYRHVLESRKPVVDHSIGYRNKGVGKGMSPFNLNESQMFAGSTTSKYRGVPMYPEFLALTLWPELWSLPKRKVNPYQISTDEVEILNEKVFPHWIKHNILELTRAHHQKNPEEMSVPEIALLEKLVFFMASKPNCISHTIPDFSRVINEGMAAIIDDADQRKKSVTDAGPKEFYAAVSEVLKGIIAYSKRLADEAVAAKKGKYADRQRELDLIADIHRRVPEKPADSFREGLSAIWVCWIACHLENANVGLSLGRLDQVLYPLYKRDVESGTITPKDAIEMLCCLWLKIGDHVPTVPEAAEQLLGGTGSNQAITVGGVDMQGKNAVNDLTYVILKATELMMLRDPNLNARYHPDAHNDMEGDRYLRRLCEVNVNTKSTPALHNDRAVIEALSNRGDGLKNARDYGVVGCVEPCSNGRAYGHSGAILINLTSVLELALFNGRHRHTGKKLISIETGAPKDLDTFDKFKTALRDQLGWMAEQTTSLNNAFGRTHQRFYPTPILSALFEGPMENGMDVIEGGAKINSSGVAIIGLADVIDSLSAIERVVYEKKEYSLDEMISAINNNFKNKGKENGNEKRKKAKDFLKLKARLNNPKKTPKYGNEDPKAEANAKWLVGKIDEAFKGIKNYREGKYRVGYWSMTNHAGLGNITGALPSGRESQKNFASGITPVSGMTAYLTPVLNSVGALPTRSVTNGMALNIKYTPLPASHAKKDMDKMLDLFMASVKGYFAPKSVQGTNQQNAGGMEIQFNVTSRATFRKAIKNPDPELLVRVSGYTAYFKDLTPEMQQEIIERAEYGLLVGKAV